jgi:hypothetical protein
MMMVAWLPPPPLCPPQLLLTWGKLFTILDYLVLGGSLVGGALRTMTITTTRIKPMRTTSRHLRASNYPSGFAMTTMVLTRLEERTMTLNSRFVCLLLNEVCRALRLVFSNSIPPETNSSTATNFTAATITNLATTTATTVAKATATALALTNATTSLFWLVVASPPCLHCGALSLSASLPDVWVAALLSASLSNVCVVVRCLCCVTLS